MDKIIERELWRQLTNELARKEVTILTGPRQVGKTTLLLKLIEHLKPQTEKIFYYNLDDVEVRSKIKRDFRFIKKDIEQKLGHLIKDAREKIYLFIDEGQKSPDIFDLVKLMYDQHLNIKVFISGSSSLNIREKTAETLSGRANYLYLFPLTFTEMAKYEHSLYSRIGFERITDEKQLCELSSFGWRKIEEIEHIFSRMLFLGGLPKVLSSGKQESITSLNNFLISYLDKDIKDVGLKVNIENFHLSFKYLSGYTANLFNFAKMAQDLGIKRDSLYRYFELLQKTLVVTTLPPLIFPAVKNIFKSRKLFFFDTGITNRLKGFMTFEELRRSDFLGNIFESFIFQNLHAKSQNDIKKPAFFYFRDYQNHEIDFIYQRGDFTTPIETTYSSIISGKKLRSFAKFFDLNRKSTHGFIFYLGEVKTYQVSGKKVFALPYFLV